MWVKVNKVFLQERFQVEENSNIVWAEWVILHKWRHKATVLVSRPQEHSVLMVEEN